MDALDEKIYEKAVKLLSARMHSTGELHDKLRTRGFPDADIRPVLQRLEELRFLDDEKFAQIFVENFKRYKDFGYFGIKAKLLKRRVPSDLAENALRDFFTLEDESAVAGRLLNKLKKTGRKTYEQLARSFQSRGFRTETFARLISNQQKY